MEENDGRSQGSSIVCIEGKNRRNGEWQRSYMKSGGRRKYLLRGYEYRSRIIYEGEGGWERCIVDERIYIYKYIMETR